MNLELFKCASYMTNISCKYIELNLLTDFLNCKSFYPPKLREFFLSHISNIVSICAHVDDFESFYRQSLQNVNPSQNLLFNASFKLSELYINLLGKLQKALSVNYFCTRFFFSSELVRNRSVLPFLNQWQEARPRVPLFSHSQYLYVTSPHS